VLFVFGASYAYEGAGRLREIVQSRVTLALALLYLAFSLAVTLSWHIKALEGSMPDALSKLIYPIDKSHLALLRLLHFLALALVVSRLMPADWHGMMKRWIMAMIRCGENSLAMYCFGVLLSFAGLVILTEISSSFVMHAAVGIGGIAPGRGCDHDDLDSQPRPARAVGQLPM
jgi:OpgC protein